MDHKSLTRAARIGVRIPASAMASTWSLSKLAASRACPDPSGLNVIRPRAAALRALTPATAPALTGTYPGKPAQPG